MLGRKPLVVIIALIMLASGIFLTYTYSSQVEGKEFWERGFLTVLANGNQSIIFLTGSPGLYHIQVEAERGTIETFFNITNTWGGKSPPPLLVFNGSSGQFTYNLQASNPNVVGSPNAGYIIFSNPDSFNEVISYSIIRTWPYNNYFYLMAGVALTALGAIILFLTLLKNKLKDFNKALENQE